LNTSSIPSSEPAPRSRATLVTVLLLSLCLIAVGVAIALRVSKALEEKAALETARISAAAAATQPREVSIVLPLAAQFVPSVVLTGTLEPIESADLGFEVGGRVARVEVALGDEVQAGQALASLDRGSVGAMQASSAAGIQVADANVALIRDRVEMLEQLARSGAAASRDLTSARQQLTLAEAQLAQARAGQRATSTASADHVIRAPFAGVVTRVPAGPGGVVGPGLPIVRIERLTSLRLRTTVAEADLAGVRVGGTVRIDGTTATGTVRSVVRSLDLQTRRAPVEVFIENAGGALIANALVRAHIDTGAPVPALRVPASTHRADGTVLVIGPDGKAAQRPVVGVADDSGDWLVTSGLEATDRVLLRPGEVREGDPVRPAAAPR
jgi:RND family efflux transporter MFP subunit